MRAAKTLRKYFRNGPCGQKKRFFHHLIEAGARRSDRSRGPSLDQMLRFLVFVSEPSPGPNSAPVIVPAESSSYSRCSSSNTNVRIIGNNCQISTLRNGSQNLKKTFKNFEVDTSTKCQFETKILRSTQARSANLRLNF